MKTALAVCLAIATAAQADSAWVQPVEGGYEVRIVTDLANCPTVYSDKGAHRIMDVRAEPTLAFKRVCSVSEPTDGKWVGYVGAPEPCPPVGANEVCLSDARLVKLPAPMAEPKRILVLGDTGCRIKGETLQACNEPDKWPFPQLAAAAAKLKPDLVIHVGDYLYRESACPAGNSGCEGSPWGDNWTTWQADFFSPAAPLLAAAPIVLARGNHEDCVRAGTGWQLLMGPGAPAPCATHVPLYTVDLKSLTLGVLDDAVSGETDLDSAMAQTYATEIGSLADAPGPVWFVHHRPTWAAITGPLGIPIGGNLTLIEAARLAEAKGKPMLPANVELQLSGHIHTFEAINYDKAEVPPQVVAGNGGDKLDITPKNLRGATFLGHSGVKVADGLSVGGFGFLLMTRAKSGWTIDLYDSNGGHTRQCHFRAGARRRVDCRA